ncbi:MAG: hypothetical protein NVSMB29_09590 [Candidatus Dormibacteria bacterium]
MTTGLRWRICVLQLGLFGILSLGAGFAFRRSSFVIGQVHDNLAAQQIHLPPAPLTAKLGQWIEVTYYNAGQMSHPMHRRHARHRHRAGCSVTIISAAGYRTGQAVASRPPPCRYARITPGSSTRAHNA